jgi:hypothetical protein
MQAYVDDSVEPPVFVLAGFVARAEQFAQLTLEWQAALDGPPRLEYFKMKEAHALEQQFKGWSKQDRDARLAVLVNIIKNHVLAGVSSVVRHEDFNEALKLKIAKPLDTPYWLMYHSIINRVFEWEIETGIIEPVDFIFDEQLHQSDGVQAHFSAFLELAPPRIKELFGERPVHRDDKKVKPLQAADMLAWHIHRDYYEREGGSEFDSPTMRALKKIPHFDSLWTKERLQALVINYEKGNRASGLVSLYENQRAEKNLPNATSINNLLDMATAPPNFSVILSPILARGTGRFLLVHSCPRSSSPHLHRRRGGKCSLESASSDSVPRQ